MANAENKKEPTAKEAYATARYDIANLLGWFECELAKDSEKTWGQVGNLQKVRRDLIETLSFLSGNKTKMIEDSLGELNNDNVDEVFEKLRNAPQPDWDAVKKDLRRHAAKNENE